MTENVNIKMALVVDTQDGYDESSVSVIDIKGAQRLAPNVYVFTLKQDLSIVDAGETISLISLQNMVTDQLRKSIQH